MPVETLPTVTADIGTNQNELQTLNRGRAAFFQAFWDIQQEEGKTRRPEQIRVKMAVAMTMPHALNFSWQANELQRRVTLEYVDGEYHISAQAKATETLPEGNSLSRLNETPLLHDKDGRLLFKDSMAVAIRTVRSWDKSDLVPVHQH